MSDYLGAGVDETLVAGERRKREFKARDRDYYRIHFIQKTQGRKGLGFCPRKKIHLS
jgi:hypothetical protein